ncbi:MAG: arylsulfatase [Verrucomicrobiales bacterium]|nr:arylsulfatase [Verrucomicrobiales bacterium]
MKSILFSLFIILSASCLHGAEGRPNVIYILADDLGYGDLSCYGQEKFQTPHIDRLATEGLKFTAHYSGNTVCTPSRAVLMTGQHSGHCYVRGNLKSEIGASLDPQMTVLPEVFKSAGYATGAFGKWGMGVTSESGAANPLSHGFDEFCGWKSQTIAHTYYPSTYVDNGKELKLKEGTYLHDVVMERARDFIGRNSKSGTPFFCYIPTAVPHAAMHAPEDLHEKWRKVFPEFDDKIGKYAAGPEDCPDVINPIAGFAAMMENLDREIGRILDQLEKLGIEKDTIVMFASDNGAHREGGHDPTFWNSSGDLRGHKRDMHEGGIRSPMLVRWPGVVAPNQTSDHISAFWDILPTMCELTGQPVPNQNDGISFLPLLKGNRDAQKSHNYLYWEFCKGPQQKIYSQAVRKGKWKAYLQQKKPMELYDLEADPYETNDLAASMPEMVSEMRAIIRDAHTPLPGASE